MKKVYIQPQTGAAVLEMRSVILSSSTGGITPDNIETKTGYTPGSLIVA